MAWLCTGRLVYRPRGRSGLPGDHRSTSPDAVAGHVHVVTPPPLGPLVGRPSRGVWRLHLCDRRDLCCRDRGRAAVAPVAWIVDMQWSHRAPPVVVYPRPSALLVAPGVPGICSGAGGQSGRRRRLGRRADEPSVVGAARADDLMGRARPAASGVPRCPLPPR
jgi:hypothetical protein